MKSAKTSHDFKKDAFVRYIPDHANNDPKHSECEDGIVTSINDTYVFVKFPTGGPTGQACNPINLISL